MSAEPAHQQVMQPVKPADAQLADFSAWRAVALSRMPYMAAMLFSVRVLDAPGLGTFAVDAGHRLYIDFEAVTEWGTTACAEVLLHEVGHLFGEHAAFARDFGVTGHDRAVWNLACFPAGTLLPGNVSIESVATMVHDYDGDLVRIVTTAGAIEATTEHPFFSRRRRHKKGLHPIVLNPANWTLGKDVQEGDYLCVPKFDELRADTRINLSGYVKQGTDSRGRRTYGNRAIQSIPLNEDVAWLIGLWVAEGSISPHVRFSLGAHETEYADRIQRIAGEIGFSSNRRYYDRNNTCIVELGGLVLGRWLTEHCGRGAKNKHIPEVILRHYDGRIRNAFLEGIMDGDGHRTFRRSGTRAPWWVLATSSKSLMHDVVLLLAQDGIGGSARSYAQRKRTINGVALPDGMLHQVAWNPDGCTPTERELNGKTIASCTHRWKADDDGVWYPVKDVSRRPFSGPVYNMETDSHTYVAHGFLVHNCDASLNDDLATAGCHYIASTGIMPAKLGEPDFQTAQHYYTALQRLRQQQVEPGRSGTDGDGQQQHGPFAGCGSGAGGEAAPCELDEGDDLAGQAPTASPGERARLRVSTAAQIVEHAARGRGTVPAGLVEQAELILAPSTTPWQRLVGAAVRRVVRRRAGQERTDYTRRDRRRHNVTIGDWGAKVVFPGKSSPKVRIAVVRDTSGSMSAQELDVVTSEIIAISRRLRIKGKDLIVLDVDADVHATRGFTGAAGLRDVHGRGGTDMRVGIDTALATPGGVDLVVVLTDGGTPWPTDRTRVPVIACLVGPWAPRTEQDVPDWIARIVVTDPADQG